MVLDPQNSKKQYLNFKEQFKKRTKKLSKVNSDYLLSYLEDMEVGNNTANKKPLSYIRLKTIKIRIMFVMQQFQKRYKVNDITQVPEKTAQKFFKEMSEGIIKKSDGKPYKSTKDYLRVFKAFWHWYERVEGRKGNRVLDITKYIDVKDGELPDFVYLDESQLRLILDHAKYDYKVMIWFIYDTGIRFPKECLNVKCKDITKDNGFTYINIKDESAKTFGRKFKMHLSKELVWQYIERKKLKDEDYLFTIDQRNFNQYIKRLSERVLGKAISQGGKRYNEISGYDLRHSSVGRFRSFLTPQIMMFKYGWKNLDMYNRYAKKLGWIDTSDEEDLVHDTTKSDMQNQIENLTIKLATQEDEINLFKKKIQDIWNETMIQQHIMIETLFPDIEDPKEIKNIIEQKRKQLGMPTISEEIESRKQQLEETQKAVYKKLSKNTT